MKKRITIEKVEIPPFDKGDILATTQRIMQSTSFSDVQKRETAYWKLIKQIIQIYGWKSMALQSLVVIIGLILVWRTPTSVPLASLALLSTGGIIMATVIAGESIHSDIYGMREVELSCFCNPQRILIWKMLLLSILAMLGIGLLSYATMLKTDFDFTTLLYGGCIPFLFMNAMTLMLHTKGYPFQTLGIFYSITFVLMCAMEYGFLLQIVLFLETWGSAMAIALFLINMLLAYMTRAKRCAL